MFLNPEWNGCGYQNILFRCLYLPSNIGSLWKGGSSSITKEFTVFIVWAWIQLLFGQSWQGGAPKTWVVDKSVPGHLVLLWGGSYTWMVVCISRWKVNCCNCFYTATFAFTKLSDGYQLQVATPDGAFTKTGFLLHSGIPSSGDEGCYAYGGATSAFSFSASQLQVSQQNTILHKQVSFYLVILHFIGYGSLRVWYEILVLSSFIYVSAGTRNRNRKCHGILNCLFWVNPWKLIAIREEQNLLPFLFAFWILKLIYDTKILSL